MLVPHLLRLLQGLQHRRGVVAVLLLVAALTTGAGAAALTYQQAAADSALRSRLLAAPAGDAGVEVAGNSSPRVDWQHQLAAGVPRLPFSSARILGISAIGADSSGEQMQLFWRDDVCRYVTFTSGRCPSAVDEAAVPAGWRAGTALAVSGVAESPTKRLRYRIVGRYEVPAPDDPYWMSNPPGDGAPLPDGSQTRLPAVLLDRTGFRLLPAAASTQIVLDQPLSAERLTTADVPVLRRGLQAIQAKAGSRIVITQLPQLLDADHADRSVLRTVVLLAAAQLIGLVGLVLLLLLTLAVTARRTEVLAGTLSGRRPALITADVLIEPAAVLVVGAVLGLLGTPLVVRLAAAIWLRPDTPVRWTLSAVLAAVAVGGVGLLAATVVAWRFARRPAADQLAAAPASPHRRAAWWEITVFTAAAAGLVELLTAGGVRAQATPWALLAPVLCGLAIGLALARLVPLTLGRLLDATDSSPHLSTFLLVRELRRDATSWRIAAVVAVAVSLLAFAVPISRGAAADRQDRAGLLVGADQVLSVVPPSGVSIQSVVSHLDPGGRWAMAAEQITPFGSAALRTLAVDASRLARVESWSRPLGGLGTQELGHALQPTRPRPFRFFSRALSLPVQVDQLHASAPLHLAVTLVQPDGTRVVRTGQRVQLGARTYTWPTPECTQRPGCRLLVLEVQRPDADFSDYSIDFTVAGLDHGPWTVQAGQGRRTQHGWRITAAFGGGMGQTVDLVRNEMPTRLPAVTAGPTGGTATGLDGQQLPIAPVARTASLPRLLDAGGLVDLSYADLAATSADAGGTLVDEQIWLGRGAPPDVNERLRRMGVAVLHTSRTSTQATALAYLAPAAGLNAYLAVALLSAAVALGLLAAAAAIAGRRRRAEYVTLATAGITTATLTRAWVGAAVARLAFAGAAGLAAGLATAHLAAPGVPLTAPGAVPAAQLSIPALPAIIATIATLAPLILVEIAGIRWSARPAALRHLRQVAA